MAFSREFALDKDILSVDSSEKISVGLSTDSDVLEVILNDTPFPNRDNGAIDLAHITLEAQAGKNVKFNAGSGDMSWRPTETRFKG